MQHEKWALPERFQLDKERLKAAQEKQREWAAKVSTPARLSPSEFARGRAAQQIPEMEDALAYVRQQIGQAMVSGGEFEELRTAETQIKEDLAQAYADIGRFDKAGEYSVQPEAYQAIWSAVWGDGATCEHWILKPFPVYAVRKIWSLKEDKELPLLRCRICGVITVAPMPRNLEQQRQARQKAMEMVGKLPPDEAKRVLTERGHTSAKML